MLTYRDIADATERMREIAIARHAPLPSTDDTLAALFRPIVRAPEGHVLLIADYGQIEARAVNWNARQQWVLDVFADETRDIYCETASRIFGRAITKKDKTERFIGKVVELGSGYSMSAAKLKMYCKVQQIDLDAAQTTAEACIKVYRGSHPLVVKLWSDVGDAAMRAITSPGKSYIAGRCEFSFRESSLCIRLPSSRVLWYRGARIEDRVPGYCKMLGIPDMLKPTVVYQSPHGYAKTTYGGSLTENIVQAECRDILTDALIRLHSHLRIPLHVHDEIVAIACAEDADAQLRMMAEMMVDGPAWARGFPIKVEAFANPVYAKNRFMGFPECTLTKCKA